MSFSSLERRVCGLYRALLTSKRADSTLKDPSREMVYGSGVSLFKQVFALRLTSDCSLSPMLPREVAWAYARSKWWGLDSDLRQVTKIYPPYSCIGMANGERYKLLQDGLPNVMSNLSYLSNDR